MLIQSRQRPVTPGSRGGEGLPNVAVLRTVSPIGSSMGTERLAFVQPCHIDSHDSQVSYTANQRCPRPVAG